MLTPMFAMSETTAATTLPTMSVKRQLMRLVGRRSLGGQLCVIVAVCLIVGILTLFKLLHGNTEVLVDIKRKIYLLRVINLETM